MARRRRGPDGCFRSAALADRARDIRRAARGRYTVAETPVQKLAAAVDYVRSAAAACSRAGIGGVAEALATATVALMAAGDELTAALDRQGVDR